MNGLATPYAPIAGFAVILWVAIGSLLALAARSRAETARGFFLADRSLPWPLVALSSIASEASLTALLVLPGAMAALEGNLTPLFWCIGALAARGIIAAYFVPSFYEGEVQSPYDVIGRHLGSGAKAIATACFIGGGLLGHGARIFLLIWPISLLGGPPYLACFALVMVCAMLWVCLGGMRALVWTDSLHFLLLMASCLGALLWVLGHIDGGWEQIGAELHAAEAFAGPPVNKLKLIDFAGDALAASQLLMAALVLPFLPLHTLGVDQVHAQRLFCCRGSRDARKAVLWAGLGQVLCPLLLLLGGGIFVYYRLQPPTDPAILSALNWSGQGPSVPAAVLPVWATTELPPLLQALLLVLFLAAAVSALESLLLALSQTSHSLLRGSRPHQSDARRLVRLARWLVLAWGILLIPLILAFLNERLPLPYEPRDLSRAIPILIAGPLLALFILALMDRATPIGLYLGLSLSLSLGLLLLSAPFLFPDTVIAKALRPMAWPPLRGGVESPLLRRPALEVWIPLSALLTFLCAWIFRKPVSAEKVL